jgi:hypothetical protein
LELPEKSFPIVHWTLKCGSQSLIDGKEGEGMTVSELKKNGIECYADNDGGLWYWDYDGKMKTVEEGEENGD